MALIGYDDRAAAAFAATRELPRSGLGAWRSAIGSHLRPHPGMRVLDVGAGTGSWTRALVDWYGVDVVAVEPAAAMRSRAAYPMVGGRAEALPLADARLDAAWMSTVVHHLSDLPDAARELRRVLRPGAPVLIRSVFAGRHDGIPLLRLFPEAARVVDAYPSVAAVRRAFEEAGFVWVGLEPVPQVSADSWAAAAAVFRREAHTPLLMIDDDAYAAGLARLHDAARTVTGPVVDTLDLVVLRLPG